MCDVYIYMNDICVCDIRVIYVEACYTVLLYLQTCGRLSHLLMFYVVVICVYVYQINLSKDVY